MILADKQKSESSECLYILSPRLNLSGVSKTSQNVANYLHQQGQSVRYICADSAENAVCMLDENITVEYLEIPPQKSFSKVIQITKLFVSFYNICRQPECKIILIWGKEYAVLFWFCRLFSKLKPKIIGVNSSVINFHLKESLLVSRFIKKIIYYYSLKKIEFWIAASKGVKYEMINCYNVEDNKVSVIYPSIDKLFFSNSDNSLKKDLLFVGRLEPAKNPILLINSTMYFLKSNSDLKLRIVGDGSLRGEMEKYVETNGLTEQVVFEGDIKNPVSFYKKAKLLVLTSRYEGFGMVIVEAMAMGVPVLSLDVPSGPREIINNGENGFLVKNQDEFMRVLHQAYFNNFTPRQIRDSVQPFNPDVVLPKYYNFIKIHMKGN